MARLPLVDPQDGPLDAVAALQAIAGERGQAFNVYRMLANSPRTLERVYALSSYLWNESSLPPRLQELVILRVALLKQSDYEWAKHRNVSRRVGVPEEQVAALARWREHPDRFDAVEQAALALTEEATQHVEASAEAVARVRALIGEAATLELVVLIGFYGMVAVLLRSLAVDADPGDELLPR